MLKKDTRKTAVNQNGKTKKPYTGKYYTFIEDDAMIDKLRKIYPAALIALSAIYIASLFLAAVVMRVFYVNVPYLCVFLTYVFMWNGVYRLCRTRPPYTSDGRDKLFERIRKTTCLAWILMTVAAIGSAFALVSYWDGLNWPDDLIFTILAVVQSVSNFLLFFASRWLEMRSVKEKKKRANG